MEITYRRLSTLPLEEAVRVWNEGFSGYLVPISMTVESFLTKLGLEGLVPSKSLVAYVDGEAAGMVVNGFRTFNGQKAAWNGGTGIAPKFRGKGVGKALMEATLALYEEEGVELAILEALHQNEPAIRLYQSVGYEIVDRLVFYTKEGVLEEGAFGGQVGVVGDLGSVGAIGSVAGLDAGLADSGVASGRSGYVVKRGGGHDVRNLGFYRHLSPYQTQASVLRDGESVIVLDAAGEAVGYALFRRTFDDAGKLIQINLMQCEVAAEQQDARTIAQLLLRHAYGPLEVETRRGTFNYPASNTLVAELLREEGFSLTNEQVYMIKQMERKS
ncbi:GNAT family N-acetyltransferase [Brevibacillus dissolubilis]|uniref:GNAT family N-acetyltransferase n=1 Tax=Brevibacillus dissolubilis TaxID=1844116 RepID=UPI00159BE950|nr:GNAT family N-acetyltransferase [Brevibacillus dissolubilis]